MTNQAQKLIEQLIEGKFDEQDVVNIIWKRLPSNIRSKVDLKKLRDFVEYLESGDNLQSAAKSSKIPTATAVELTASIEKMGLL